MIFNPLAPGDKPSTLEQFIECHDVDTAALASKQLKRITHHGSLPGVPGPSQPRVFLSIKPPRNVCLSEAGFSCRR